MYYSYTVIANTNRRYFIHHKKRKLYNLDKRVSHLKLAPMRVKIPKSDIFIVGSKGETLGNQVCQWDGESLEFRVPYYLENKYGKTLTTKLGNYNRNINRISDDGAKTWHFYFFGSAHKYK